VLDYEHARHRMVDAHIARRGVRDERVLAALRKVARETFVDAGFEEFSYEDSPLPIGERPDDLPAVHRRLRPRRHAVRDRLAHSGFVVVQPGLGRRFFHALQISRAKVELGPSRKIRLAI
jgi:protein-L-isoaspartate O-methyltransferase